MASVARRIVWGGLLVLLVLLAALGAGVAQMFLGLRPVEDGATFDGIRIVADGFSAMGVVPAGNGQFVLIDAGMDPSAAALKAELARRQVPLSAVRAVLLTHGHADHLGAIAALPGVEVMALEPEVAIVEGTRAPASLVGWVTPLRRTGIAVTRPLRDGETVTVGEPSIRVFAVPGHTGGSAAYLVNGVLFVGDSAQITSDGEIRPAPFLVTDDRAQNRASLVALATRLRADGSAVTAVVPAHSGPAQGLGALERFAATGS